MLCKNVQYICNIGKILQIYITLNFCLNLLTFELFGEYVLKVRFNNVNFLGIFFQTASYSLKHNFYQTIYEKVKSFQFKFLEMPTLLNITGEL